MDAMKAKRLTSVVHIIDQMVKECWATIGESLLTTSQFQEDVAQIKQYFFTKLSALSEEDLLSFFLAHLRIYEYKIVSQKRIDGFTCAELSACLPDSTKIQGLAIFMPKAEQLEAVHTLLGQPQYGFFEIFVPPSEARIEDIQFGPNVRVVTQRDLLKTFAGIMLWEYFGVYDHALRYTPGLKERKSDIIKQETGLIWEEINHIRKGWSKITNKAGD